MHFCERVIVYVCILYNEPHSQSSIQLLLIAVSVADWRTENDGEYILTSDVLLTFCSIFSVRVDLSVCQCTVSRTHKNGRLE